MGEDVKGPESQVVAVARPARVGKRGAVAAAHRAVGGGQRPHRHYARRAKYARLAKHARRACHTRGGQ